MTGAHLVAARRSAVVPRNGAFATLEPHDLAAVVLNAALDDAGLRPDEVGELVLSNALGGGGNPARLAVLAAGWPERIAGLSIDRQCAGGLDALIMAAALIRSGQHEVVVAGGVESYSRRPLRFRTFADGRPAIEYQQARFTPWPDRDPEMAEAAHRLAERLGIGKAEQDDWAIRSHASAARGGAAEIVPVAGMTRDPFNRRLTDKVCQRAARVHGTITAANMAVAADGAAFVVMVSDARIRDRRSVAYVAGATLGGDPELPGLAPVEATRQVLAAAGIAPDRLAAVEIMEAFAVQAIACQRGADLPIAVVNQAGGALARGHPIGASGAVLAARLFHALREPGDHGLATIAAAGGLGTAVLLRAGA